MTPLHRLYLLVSATMLAVLVTARTGAATALAQPPVPGDRMAAHHLTMVAVNETRPNAGLMTYVVDRFTQVEAYGLARLSVHAEIGGKLVGPSEATGVMVEDLPGGVRADYRLGRVRVTTEIVPLLRGRGEGIWEGSAAFSVRTEPSAPVHVLIGGSRTVGFQSPRGAWLQADDPTSPADSAMMYGPAVVLRSGARPAVVAFSATRSDGPADLRLTPEGRMASVRFANGHGRVVIAYARDETRAMVLATDDAISARREVADHYACLLKSRIRTPEPTLDAAFRSAMTTLEYNWIEPIGWNECIHHWYSLWHMQHSPAAEWIGQADRSRACILTHAENLLPNGAAPQLSVDGRARRDFGGSNQFYAWQIRHYLRHTGDIEAARKLAPVLDRVIAQTWEEYDPDGNGLLAWGQQIGNQEDYVSTPHDGATPTIEGIQMLLTRAEVAAMLGERDTDRECRERADALRAKLRDALWMQDLGRFAFYRDALGVIRPDGQYHTYAYPAIFGIVDDLDAWTSVRHMREVLTGKDGEVYCSNNFPWHAVGTWGMQAGAAQQPWAAWALAATGHRNETYRPLLAAARWAMDANHRGSWPEISTEPTPAYFSPPAGLYVQAVIEALFGLTMDKRAGTLRIAPSLPDAWAHADLDLPAVSVRYRRARATISLDVSTARPMARHLRWMLPPCVVRDVTANGKRVVFGADAAVNGIVLTASSAPSRRTRFEIKIARAPCDVRHRSVVAEGDAWTVETVGSHIERIEDRSGLLTVHRIQPTISGSVATAEVRRGLLRSYDGLGRLGRVSFSRRTLFLWLRTPGGARFACSVTVTVLPRVEASASLAPTERGATLRIRVRNNAGQPCTGAARIAWAGGVVRSSANLKPRAEGVIGVALPSDTLALLSAGDNRFELALPGCAPIAVTVDASAVHESAPALRSWMASRSEAVPLPEADLAEDTGWREWREWYAYGHWPWANSKPPLEAWAGKPEVAVPGLPEVRFAHSGRRLVPISWRIGRPSFTLNLQGRTYRKLYLLALPFLDNHDTFAPVARVTVRMEDGGVRDRVLSFPGDLDWWCPAEVVGSFATAPPSRTDRLGMCAAPEANGRWKAGLPPDYPQRELWATCRVVAGASAVMNVVEVDLGAPSPMHSVTLATIGSEPAIGLVAVTGEAASGHSALAGTSYDPPLGLREPVRVFGLNRAGDLEGWAVEGDAFSVAPAPGLFTKPTLNSIASHGESAIGRAVSPPFVLALSALRFRIHGGHSSSLTGDGALQVRLLDAASGEVLATMGPPGTHMVTTARFDVARWMGRRVRIELLDRNAAPSYAWIGISDVALSPR